mgnify:CR=1 FL=1
MKGKGGKGRSSMLLTERGTTVLVVSMVMMLAVISAIAQDEAEVTKVTVNAPEYVEEGETFDVTIDVEGIEDFNNGMFDIHFDHEVVKVEDVKEGSIGDTEIPIPMWDHIDSDTIKVILELSGTATVSGSGYLAEITFKVEGDEGDKSALEISEGELGKYIFEDDMATIEAIEANWNNATVKVGVEDEDEDEDEDEPTSTPTLAPGGTPASTPEANVTVTPSPTMTSRMTPSPTPTLALGETPTPTLTPTVKPTATPIIDKKTKTTPTPESGVPGFGAVFAIALMLGIAYILLRLRGRDDE